MHELSFAEQILECVERTAQGHSCSRVVRIRLSAPETLGLNKDSLIFCLQGIATGTIVEGAEIEVVEKRLELTCPQCGPIPADPAAGLSCPVCGQPGALPACNELIIEEIELDAQDDQA
jgi:hydrogenase nickel incorporation protein HypA/HybF